MLADHMDASIAHVRQINIDDFAVILTTIAVVRSRRDAFEEGLGVTSRRPPGFAKVSCRSPLPLVQRRRHPSRSTATC